MAELMWLDCLECKESMSARYLCTDGRQAYCAKCKKYFVRPKGAINLGNNRFDYVKYDDKAKVCQTFFKAAFMGIEDTIQRELKSPRSKALALTKMEESYMWIGKAIRDDQIERNGGAALE